MKILLANKYFYPRGGDCLYTIRLRELLEKNGHHVAIFSMRHPQNLPTDYDKYFVDHIDYREELKNYCFSGAIRVASRSIVNRQAVGLFGRLLDDFKPDIVHLQNIHHQLTPAIINPAVARSIPIVWTLHDYNLFCPDHTFYQHNKICQKCANGEYYHAVLNRCKKGSVGASFLAALECYIYNPWKLATMVNKFICPSSFMAQTLIKYKIPPEKVETIPNFMYDVNQTPRDSGYFLFVGQLIDVKGIRILIEAFRNLHQLPLIIAGDGPLKNEIEDLINKYQLRNISLLGHQTPEKILKLLSSCRALIFPSIWLENLPYSIMEAMACAKPIIASDIGGVPEMIEHRVNGLLFEPSDSESLADYIVYLSKNPHIAEQMGEHGRQKFHRLYTSETHYRNVMKIYQQVSDNINVHGSYERVLTLSVSNN